MTMRLRDLSLCSEAILLHLVAFLDRDLSLSSDAINTTKADDRTGCPG
jgi:hypothetical protein